MTEQASFTLRGRNPDVLTCIANLSNDEVFTPPEFANRMLDTLAEAWASSHNGANLWADKTVRFLDPCTKSGVFLREITSRLVQGLAAEIPDLQTRVDHILTQQIFGIGITKLTSLLARRSVYCSKDANSEHSITRSFTHDAGNIWFERVEHTWANGKCRFCGASQSAFDRGEELETHAYAIIHTDDIKTRLGEIFGDNMQFDVIIGNPPYQLDDGGHGKSAAPIYHLFVEQAKKLEPRFLSLVIPARWFAGGKGLDEFRESMLADNRTRVIHDYWLVGDAFPGVAIQGGILYFLWNREAPGDCEVVTHYNGKVQSSAKRPLLEHGSDVFIRYNEAAPILKKIVAVEGGMLNSVSLPKQKRFTNFVSARKPFGLPTNFKVRTSKRDGDVLTYWNGGPGFKQGGVGWVSRTEINEGIELIEKWKVFIGGAYGDRGGGGASRDAPPKAVLGRPFIGEPGSISTETYICIGPLESENEAKNVCSYISCKLTRFLVMLHKPSQHATKKVYTFVPTQDFSQTWTDAKLYAKYGLTDEEIAFIEWMIRPMHLNSINAPDEATPFDDE
ncbi:site-specific DNA-methyltransferase (adenine-specific) [Allochromatium warmingii]|uniref:Site-specific DNA-methyltransferase (Adenine-specific) n=1 Tax=Allochromatium warmingii TaxID=61595 RepID=A0A1H3G2P0_ALLWA|nr:Eco57I restriction-modification methylase domain-containing protein [Allochromatium warmingii]SDX97486.1 site-specific DNA-methyltransferase (adenine-specific) [Allochromatium warmingii]